MFCCVSLRSGRLHTGLESLVTGEKGPCSLMTDQKGDTFDTVIWDRASA